uniref:Related to DOA1-involved in ubiquitin-dependent proteolysis n=1 Tax=Melanopsichium pennsylvanicum 4 TaxID=1398559 RepID=A0A077RA96_9BASI|nr:related to DOA1-involved in ubiquitin-dependent proteolysis [Melanopsichium pennsylvanicum 4]
MTATTDTIITATTNNETLQYQQSTSRFRLTHVLQAHSSDVLLGSLDSQIRCFDPLRPDKPLQVLSDHWDNISVLKPYNGIKLNDNEHSVPPVLISASWDKTARVWIWDATRAECGKEQEKEKELGGSSTNSGKGRYLTSSADLFIRLFHGDQLYAVYAGHTDVVRSLELLPILPCQVKHDDDDKGICEQATGIPALYPNEQLFASTSNDGTVRIWSLDPRRSPTQGNGGDSLRVLQAYTSLVYDLAAYVDHATQKPRLIEKLISVISCKNHKAGKPSRSTPEIREGGEEDSSGPVTPF